jgi:hypothetical protein
MIFASGAPGIFGIVVALACLASVIANRQWRRLQGPIVFFVCFAVLFGAAAIADSVNSGWPLVFGLIGCFVVVWISRNIRGRS